MLPALVLFRPKGRDLQGRGTFSDTGFLIPLVWNVIASLAFFMPIRDAYFQQSYEVMEPRCVLLPLRTIAALADCTRSQFGAGRNRYRRLVPGAAPRSLQHIISPLPAAVDKSRTGSGP